VLSIWQGILLCGLRRKGSLWTDRGKRFYHPPSFSLGFALVGRPTKQQFILAYGEKGLKMTWAQRAKAGLMPSTFKKRSKQSPEVGEIDRPLGRKTAEGLTVWTNSITSGYAVTLALSVSGKRLGI